MSCAVCHPDGEVDGRQWDFGGGPLDTHTLRGALACTPLHYTAHLDEIQDTYDFTRHTMAGRWFVRKHEMNDYLGVSNAGYSRDLDALAAYIGSLAPKRPPTPPLEALSSIEKGRRIFFSEKAGCAACHPPPLYTDSGQKDARGDFIRHNVGMHREGEDAALQSLDTPSLLGLRQSEPYLHDGKAPTLESVFTHHNQEDLHGHTSHLSENDIHCLSEFIRYLDPGPPTTSQQFEDKCPVLNKLLDLVYQDEVKGNSRTGSRTLQDLPDTAQGCCCTDNLTPDCQREWTSG